MIRWHSSFELTPFAHTYKTHEDGRMSKHPDVFIREPTPKEKELLNGDYVEDVKVLIQNEGHGIKLGIYTNAESEMNALASFTLTVKGAKAICCALNNIIEMQEIAESSIKPNAYEET